MRRPAAAGNRWGNRKSVEQRGDSVRGPPVRVVRDVYVQAERRADGRVTEAFLQDPRVLPGLVERRCGVAVTAVVQPDERLPGCDDGAGPPTGERVRRYRPADLVGDDEV